MPLSDAVLVLCAVALGGVAAGATGFGAAIVAAPLVALGAPQLLPFVLLPAGVAGNVAVVARDRRHCDHAALRRLAIAQLPGAAAGAWLLTRLDVRELAVVVAVMAALAVVAGALPLRRERGRSAFLAAGLLSGLSGTTTGLNGPPIAAVLAGVDPARFRATAASFFLTASAVTMAMWTLFGVLDLRALALGVAVAPAAVGGVAVGRRLHGWLTASRLRWIGLALATAGIARSVAVL